jgi:hypothetical protein
MRAVPRPRPIGRPRRAWPAVAIGCAVVALGCTAAATPAAARVAGEAPAQAGIQQGGVQQGSAQQGSAQQGSIQQGGTSQAASTEKTGTSLESAAAKAGDTARTVAMSLIGLALAIASIVLAFRRDFKEAAGVFAVGIVAVLLATPAGLSLLRDTVTSLFGS